MNLNKLCNKWRLKKFPSHFHLHWLSIPFCVDWLRDFLRRSLLIIKEFWQRPLLPLSLFFIHGHELLIAVHRGHRAKTMRPIASLLLMSWGRRNNTDKRLERMRSNAWPCWLYCLCCKLCKHYKLPGMGFSSSAATFPVTHSLAEYSRIVWAFSLPEHVFFFSFSPQDGR